MESIRSVLRAIVVFLAVILDPVINLLNTVGVAMRRSMDEMRIPTLVQPVGIIAAWFLLILLMIRFLRGLFRLAALVFVALVLMRIYGVLPDF